MHPKRYARRTAFWGAILAAGLAAGVCQAQQPPAQPLAGGIAAQPPAQPLPAPPGAPAAMPPAEVKVDPKTGTLIVPVGETVYWVPALPEPPTDFLVSREDVIQMKPDPRDPKKFFLTGKMTGLSQVTFTFKNAPLRMVFDVLVQPDLNLLRTVIRRTIPTAAVEVQPGIGNNSIIVSGYVTSPQDAATVQQLAVTAAGAVNGVINAVQVGGVQQVQIDVVVASVDRTLARYRGLDFAIGGNTVNFQSIVSGLITSSLGEASAQAAGGGAGSSLLPLITTTANLQLGIIPAQFYGAMQALRTEGIAKFLAEPKVVTQSGRPAFFMAGGQQAVISGTAGITGPGVSYVPFGTQLDVLPIVYGNGMIWLEIDPRITAVSSALGITIAGSVSPGFTQQEVKSAVMLESGQTFAIGGLIQNTVQATANKVPILGELPFVGIAFSSITHSQTESELVIMVTPRLVAPMNCDQVPKRVPGRESRNPDDYELFLENIVEAPRGQRKVWSGGHYNAAYKCDPTAAIFPCVGGVCNPRGGCNAPAGYPGMMRPVPPALPAGPGMLPGSLPVTPPVGGTTGPAERMLPSVPGSPVGAGATLGDNGSGLPAVVALPEVPRN